MPAQHECLIGQALEIIFIAEYPGGGGKRPFIFVSRTGRAGAVAELVGIEGGVVSGVINLESSGVEASDQAPALRHAS